MCFSRAYLQSLSLSNFPQIFYLVFSAFLWGIILSHFKRICLMKIALDFNLFIISQPLNGTSFSKGSAKPITIYNQVVSAFSKTSSVLMTSFPTEQSRVSDESVLDSVQWNALPLGLNVYCLVYYNYFPFICTYTFPPTTL